MSQAVREQLADVIGALSQQDPVGAERVIERDDVVDALTASLEEQCFESIGHASGVVAERRIRATLRVILNLERIGDAACHMAKHCLMLAHEDEGTLPVSIDDLGAISLAGVDESARSFVECNVELAKTACERERQLDEIYVRRLEELAGMVNAGEVRGHVLLHTLAVLKYLEKVCDFVLNIGEATFNALTGGRLTYAQFRQLEALLPGGLGEDDAYRHFWDGISGATVIEVRRRGGPSLIFKEGSGRKVQDEYYRAIEWEGTAPDHTARVIGLSEARGRSSILREFVQGRLFLDLLVSDAQRQVKEEAMRQVTDVLVDIWTRTITPLPPTIDYVPQIRTRLRDVLRRHPHLERVSKSELKDYGGLYDFLTHLAAQETRLRPPFSIWTHGDLNANNIVMDQKNDGVIFIDVHRSRYGDYLQDVAVLATSSVRQFPKGKAAKGVAGANEVLFKAAVDFGLANNDRQLKTRLRLARARAVLTSARLETEPDRAERLFVEGLGLLKKVAKKLKVPRAD